MCSYTTAFFLSVLPFLICEMMTVLMVPNCSLAQLTPTNLESQILRISKSQNLRISEPRIFRVYHISIKQVMKIIPKKVYNFLMTKQFWQYEILFNLLSGQLSHACSVFTFLEAKQSQRGFESSCRHSLSAELFSYWCVNFYRKPVHKENSQITTANTFKVCMAHTLKKVSFQCRLTAPCTAK